MKFKVRIFTANRNSTVINYKDVRNDRQWKASTDLSAEQFFILVEMFGEDYEQLFRVSLVERQNNSTNENTFKTYEDLLFFSLYSPKSGLTYDLSGVTFGLGKCLSKSGAWITGSPCGR